MRDPAPASRLRDSDPHDPHTVGTRTGAPRNRDPSPPDNALDIPYVDVHTAEPRHVVVWTGTFRIARRCADCAIPIRRRTGTVMLLPPVERGGRKGESHPERVCPDGVRIVQSRSGVAPGRLRSSPLSKGEAGRGIASRESARPTVCGLCNSDPAPRRDGYAPPPCRKGRPEGESRPESARPDGVRIVQSRSGAGTGRLRSSPLSKGEAGRGNRIPRVCAPTVCGLCEPLSRS